MKRSTPMKRTGFKRKPLKEGQNAKSRSTFKPKPKKVREGYHNQAALDACVGQLCYLKVPNLCRGAIDKDTVVYCHSNQSRHGKGLGLKARDIYTVPGCFRCHAFIDQNRTGASKAVKFKIWDDAYAAWLPVRVLLIGE